MSRIGITTESVLIAASSSNGDFGDMGPSGAAGRVCAFGRNLSLVATKESD